MVNYNKNRLNSIKEKDPGWDDPYYMIEYYKQRREELKNKKDDKYVCPQCGQKSMMPKAKQMRSAHKGMTYFLVCSSCGKMVRADKF